MAACNASSMISTNHFLELLDVSGLDASEFEGSEDSELSEDDVDVSSEDSESSEDDIDVNSLSSDKNVLMLY